jgi:hypothetical protein
LWSKTHGGTFVDWAFRQRTYFIEGVPGLAKTLAINTLSQAIRVILVEFNLLRFIACRRYWNDDLQYKANEFSIKKGPIFANFFWPMRLTSSSQSTIGIVRGDARKTSYHW